MKQLLCCQRSNNLADDSSFGPWCFSVRTVDLLIQHQLLLLDDRFDDRFDDRLVSPNFLAHSKLSAIFAHLTKKLAADLLHHPPCPPIGPAHEKCVAKKSEESSGGGSSSGSSSYSDGATESSSESSTGGYNGSGIQSGTRVSAFQMLMLIAAAIAAAMAIAAVVAGQRRQEKKSHALTGSVARRMNLFQNFCDSALCDSAERPSRVIEMTMSVDDYDDINHHNNNKHSAMV